MKIEIIRSEDELYGKIAIDGIVDEESSVYDRYLNSWNPDTIEKLKTIPISKLEEQFDTVTCSLELDWSEWDLSVMFQLKGYIHDSPLDIVFPTVSVEPQIIFTEWNKFFSLRELQEMFKKSLENHTGDTFFSTKNFPEELFSIIYRIEDKHKQGSLGSLLDDILGHYRALYNSVMNYFSQDMKSDLITTLFEFPEDLKTSCKQYLMYFGQFLADLGINADTSIKEEANRVLFTVAPEDGAEALDKIKEALNIFLNAPGSMDFGQSNNVQKDIAQIQWESNIYHFKSQLALAQAMIEAKNATIETQKATIEMLKISNFQLQEMISTSRQLPQVRGEEKSKEEKIMGGVVSLKQYEGKGFAIDFAELFRNLKRRFKKP